MTTLGVTHHAMFVWDKFLETGQVSLSYSIVLPCLYSADSTDIYMSPVGYQDVLINTLKLRQNGRLFPDDILKRIFLNENVGISMRISLKFVLRGKIYNIPALVQIMAWRRPGDRPLSEPMMVTLPTYICLTLAQWVNLLDPGEIWIKF